MKAARGNNPRLWEPGARVVYQDGALQRHTGVVASATTHYVVLENGASVRKADICGPDRRSGDDEAFWQVVSHHESGTRLKTVISAKGAEAARLGTQARLDKMFGPGWTAKGAKRAKWQ